MATRKPKAFTRGAILPGKQVGRRASVLVLMMVAVVLIGMNKAGNPAVVQLRMHINDALAPVLGVLSSPVDVVRGGAEWVSEIVALHEENIRLRNENLQLLKLQAAHQEVLVENKALRDMLHMLPVKQHTYITARIVSDLGGPYMKAALLNGGSAAGIKVDQAVVTHQGLLGRVIEAGENSARVLLLTDLNSRVPVVTETSREKGIMMGGGHELPTLSYLDARHEITIGERVVTSGDGGIFPPGVPVGVVVRTEGGVEVRPFVNPAKTTFVSAIDYKF